MSDSTATLSAGDVVGKYKILGMAGAGGMGVVYRALDTKLERTVALKFLPEQAVSSTEEKDRFLREARFASSLDHPNIGVIHGIEEYGHRTFIVMAHYTGETVAARIRRAPLGQAEAVDLAIQVGEGLAAAHAGTVVHRDIKPSNIILTQNGTAKIVDFGLARLASATGSTQSVSTAGTIGYMSPEQTIGKFLDQRTDIWSLGIVLAEMVTGKNPFQRDTPAATIYAIINEPPAPMDDLPLDLLRVIYRALSKDPETRYQHCREMVDDLKEVRSHLEPASEAAGSSTSRPITRPITRPTGKPTTKPQTLTAADIRKQIEQASRPLWGTPTATTSKWTQWAIAASVVAVLAAALSFVPAVRDRISGWFGKSEEHIAVLPFDNIGNDPANAAISDGLMDSLSSKLTNLENDKQFLWIVPASEVRRRKITDGSSALRELGATMVVEGTMRREGQMIHMTVNLIRTKDLRQLVSVSLADQDFSTLEDEAVTRLAKRLRIDVTPEALRAGGASNAGAYELYLKALGLTQRYDKAGNLDQAIATLNDAVKADPRFALGYAQLGEAYRLKYQLDKDTKWLDDALANCNKATELDSKLPSAYVTLGGIHHSTGKYDLSLQEYQRALQLDSRNAGAQIGLALSYDSAGRNADAEAAYRKAIALRPASWDGYNYLGNFFEDHQRHEEAVIQFKRAIELTPDNASLYLNLAAVYLDKADPKDLPEAEQALRKSISLEPSYGAYANLGYLYIQEQKYKEAADTVEKALQLNDKDYTVWGNLFTAYEGLKDKDKASRALDRQLPLLEQAALAGPRDPSVQAHLGLVYAQKKVREKAISRIQSATVLAPDDPNVLETVGEAYEDLGDRKQALDCIHKSLQKGNSLANLKSVPDLQSLLADPAFRPTGK